jgi:hypothetical protein
MEAAGRGVRSIRVRCNHDVGWYFRRQVFSITVPEKPKIRHESDIRSDTKSDTPVQSLGYASTIRETLLTTSIEIGSQIGIK